MTEAVMCVLGEYETGQDKPVSPFLLEPFGRGAAVAVPAGNPHSRGSVCTHSPKEKKQESGRWRRPSLAETSLAACRQSK